MNGQISKWRTVHFMYFDAIYSSTLFWCVASNQYKGTSSVVQDQIYIKQWQYSRKHDMDIKLVGSFKEELF